MTYRTVKNKLGGVVCATFLVLFPLLHPLTISAATFTYPGPAPCNTILQACIDGVASGNVVEIATNEAIDESPRIEKSLTLRAAPGVSPLLSDFNTVLAIATGENDVAITIQGITIERGNITAIQGTTGRFDLAIIDNEIQDGSFNGGIGVRTGSTGPTRGLLFFDIARNKVTVPQGFSHQVNAISMGAYNASAYEGRISGNNIVMNVSTQGGAIMVFSVKGTGTVDVVGNVISGSGYNNGIFIRPDLGSVEARVINNLVSGQTDVAGQPGAIAASSNSDGVSVTIVNNTIVDNETGLTINGRADLGESVNGVVANNIIANNESGFLIDKDFAATVSNEHNLLFNNTYNSFTPGPGTINDDPQFIEPTDYHLRKSSPAINTGNNLQLSEEVLEDLDGNPRIENSVVDIGAYETKLFPWIILYPAFIEKK